MKIKISRTERAFFIGMGVQYLAAQPGGFICALAREVRDRRITTAAETLRKVDPYNRTVVK